MKASGARLSAVAVVFIFPVLGKLVTKGRPAPSARCRERRHLHQPVAERAPDGGRDHGSGRPPALRRHRHRIRLRFQ